MTAKPHVRRPLLVLGVFLALVAAAATVRAASLWTAGAASLANPPASISSIEAALAREQSRSAVLQDQLAAMRAASDDLANALAAANSQVSTDQATADQLQASLTAAQAKLATLEAALKAHGATGGTTTSGTTTGPIYHDDSGGVDD